MIAATGSSPPSWERLNPLPGPAWQQPKLFLLSLSVIQHVVNKTDQLMRVDDIIDEG